MHERHKGALLLSSNYLNEQSQHDAGFQQGEVLAQAVARSLDEWDKLRRESTHSIGSSCTAGDSLSSDDRCCNVSSQSNMGMFQRNPKKQDHHEGADVLVEAVILASWEEALWPPAFWLLPAVVNSLQAARQVGVLGYVLAADLVICGYPPGNNRHH